MAMDGIWAFLCMAISLQSMDTSIADYPFRNVSLPWHTRVDDLVGRLTLPDVMFQMAKGGEGAQGGPAPAIPRLGIEPWAWNTECLRGDAGAGEATGFPQAIGLAAAFNPQLIFDVAKATGVEVRAKHNDYVKHKQYGDHKGLSCFSPVINIMRHPLWGRNQETYGEDPYLSGEYAANFVKGLQGDHFRYVRANAGCKHFDVHGGPENIPQSRFSFDAKVTDRDWRLTFLPAFRQCVLAGSYSLMCSFNKINGVPACANRKLLTEITRDQWGFHGYVITDQEALENIVLFHHYANTSMQATIDAITAGLNIELTTSRKDPYFFTMTMGMGALVSIITWHMYTNSTVEAAVMCVNARCNLELGGPSIYPHIVDAIKQGKLSETLVRERVKPLFYTRMRLGEFDPPELNPYLRYNLSLVQSDEHRALAVKAAMQTIVLLKNTNGLLPIKKHFNTIAVIGPMADNLVQQYGSYAADVSAKYARSPLTGLRPLADTVNFAAGCNDNKCSNYSAPDVQKAVKGAQLVVICLGTGWLVEGEGNDRADMNLPGNQSKLITDAIKYGGGSPILLLVFSGGPLNISAADRDPRVSTIVQCFFPAQATGDAIYNVITMATNDASPAARLPYTWYDTEDQIPSMTNYSMTGRTYRYFQGAPLYPFGYGLSYTKFRYVGVELIPVILAGDNQYVYGQVMNTGAVDSDEVVQLYISWRSTNQTMPRLQLAGFSRIHIRTGESQEFKFTVNARQLAVWTDDKGFVVEPGVIDVYVGGQQPNQRRTVPSNVLNTHFQIDGQAVIGPS